MLLPPPVTRLIILPLNITNIDGKNSLQSRLPSGVAGKDEKTKQNEKNESFSIKIEKFDKFTNPEPSNYSSGDLHLQPYLPIETISDMRKIRSESNQQFMTSCLHLGSAMEICVGLNGIYNYNNKNLINVDYNDLSFIISCYFIMFAGIGGYIFADIHVIISPSLPKFINNISMILHLFGVFLYTVGANLSYMIVMKGRGGSSIFLILFIVLGIIYRIVRRKMPKYSNDKRLVHRLSVFYILIELACVLSCVIAGAFCCYTLGNHSVQCKS